MGATSSKLTCSRFACGQLGKFADTSGVDADCPAIGITSDALTGHCPTLMQRIQPLSDSEASPLLPSEDVMGGIIKEDVPTSPDALADLSVDQAAAPMQDLKASAVLEEPAMPQDDGAVPAQLVSLTSEQPQSTPQAPVPKVPKDAAAQPTAETETVTQGTAPSAPVVQEGPTKPRRKKEGGSQGAQQPGTKSKSKDGEAVSTKRAKEAKPQPKKKGYLQRLREQKEQNQKDMVKNRKLVDDIMAGKYKKEGGGQPGGDMRIRMPAPVDRINMRTMILEQYRAQYKKIGRSDDLCPSASATTQYTPAETEALTIIGGHQPIPRPKNIDLPKDFRKPFKPLKGAPIAIMSLKELVDNYGTDSNRILCSVYGDIFDVSDRPDKYGPNGPYSWMAGNDITWGFVSGRDIPETVNKCYDLWKVAPEHFRDSKLKLIYAWVAFYEWEYGNAVAKLDLYANEAGLKGPPMEESEDCCIM